MVGAHGRGRWPEVVAGRWWLAKLLESTQSPSYIAVEKTKYVGYLGGSSVVLVVSHDGGGDGGARGSRRWQWVARKWPESCWKIQQKTPSLGEESAADWGRGLG